MAIRDIVLFPDPILRKKASKVARFDQELHELLEDLADTLYDSLFGVGLAAPQIGVLQRVIVMDCGDGLIELVNPVIMERSGTQNEPLETCLSIPGVRGRVNRDEYVVILAQDRQGNPVELKAEGLLARCAQHEIDHLDGILFIDRAEKVYRGHEEE